MLVVNKLGSWIMWVCNFFFIIKIYFNGVNYKKKKEKKNFKKFDNS